MSFERLCIYILLDEILTSSCFCILEVIKQTVLLLIANSPRMAAKPFLFDEDIISNVGKDPKVLVHKMYKHV